MARKTPRPPLEYRLDALIGFLPAFQDPSFAFGRMISPPDGVFVMPWRELSDVASAFVKAIYANGWCVPFDWGAWQNQAQQYVASPERVAAASAEVLEKLLTTHVRQDRFCEGHLAAMAECGHLRAILERMAVLRAEMNIGTDAVDQALPFDHDKYFAIDERTTMIPLEDLVPIRARAQGISNAKKLMRRAYNGEVTRRAPITVRRDGTKFVIVDGNSTFAVAKQAGWKDIPAHVDDEEE